VRTEGDVVIVADALAGLDEVDYVVITAGSFHLLVEVGLLGRRAVARCRRATDPCAAGCAQRRDVRLAQDAQADLFVEHQTDARDRMKSAADHLWMHFTRMAAYVDAPVPTKAKGDGAYIWDTNGKRYLDGLSGLFVVQVGHGRRELAQAAAK